MSQISLIEKKSIEELVKNLLNENVDRFIKERFPIRLIFLNSFEENRFFNKNLIDNFQNLEVIEVDKTIKDLDTWLTIDDIFNFINKLNQNKNYLILGLSEYFYLNKEDDLVNFINRSTEIENKQDNLRRKILIPIVGIYENFKKISVQVPRIVKKEWAPIYRLKEKNSFFLNCFILDLDDSELEKYLIQKYDLIKSVHDWFSLHNKSIKNKILITSNAIKTLINYKSYLRNILNISHISNYKEFLNKFFDLRINISYEEEDKQYWEKFTHLFLQGRIQKYNPFEHYIKSEFKINPNDVNSLLSVILKDKDLFNLWMIKNFLKTSDNYKNTYITYVFEKTNIDTLFSINFEKNLWLDIFKNIDNLKWINERNSLVEKIFKEKQGNISSAIESELEKNLKSIKSDKEKIDLITGLTPIEKKILIEIYNKNPELDSLIFKKYKELGYYLKDINIYKNNQHWMREYFIDYKKSKLKNKPSDQLIKILNEKNKDEESFYEWYFEFESVFQILKSEKNNVDKIVWIDALGIEWLTLIYSILKENGFSIENLNICRVNLPTITECNKFEEENLISIKDLDEYIHNQRKYLYPDSIINEIEILVNIVNKELLTGEKILVVSDHGLTAFASFHKKSKYSFSKEEINHEGRCAWINIDKPIKSNEDFIVINTNCKNDKKAVVSLRYISLANPPKRETHGGATPEEVLVPVFKIVPKTTTIKHFKINPKNFNVDIKKPIIKIYIEPVPTDVSLKDNSGNIYQGNFDFKDKNWFFNLKNLSVGKNKLQLFINSQESGEIIVNIKTGFVEEELF